MENEIGNDRQKDVRLISQKKLTRARFSEEMKYFEETVMLRQTENAVHLFSEKTLGLPCEPPGSSFRHRTELLTMSHSVK